MIDFKKLENREINNGDIQYIFRSKNNYGASIVKHSFSYGNERGLFELAVITFNSDDNFDFSLCYSTEITDDVLGYLSEQEVNETLEKISKLTN